MVQCAAERKESRGLHYNSDYPELTDIARDSILVPAHCDRNAALVGPVDQLPAYTV